MTRDQEWGKPPARPEPAEGEVHVWRFGLDLGPAALDLLGPFLDEAERARADRFRGPGLRPRFVAGRGALRSILGDYLGVSPGSVRFAYGPHGKPSLAGPAGGLEFNLSHSHGLALLGVTIGRALGIDVETGRPPDLGGRITERYFSAAERAEFAALPADEQPAAFLRGWTRKEAYIKAVGAGLSLPLDSFDVTLGASDARLLRAGDDPEEAARWSLADLPAGPGEAAALVVRGPLTALRLWDWQGPV